MTYIQEILQRHPDATTWQQKYPWFATGQLIATHSKKNALEFETSAQQAAVFISDIPRLHWLLHQSEVDKEYLLSLLNEKQAAGITNQLSQAFETEPQFAIDLSGSVDDEEPLVEEEDKESLPAPVFSSSLVQAASSFKTETVADDSLLFETAYQHTVDYFASQGIKLEGEPAHDDRFGQQLKTFTSWLRQMKRLPNTAGQETDAAVETHAAHSLQKGDVLTEPMVDVLLKQGKKQQALQVLEKLRLLHPEKSLYFAARTEQIKHSKQ